MINSRTSAAHEGTGAPPTHPELDVRSAAFERAFERAFGLIAFAMNRHLIDHMLRAQRELKVDFDSLVIWGLLAHLNVAHLLPPGSSPKTLLDEVGLIRDPSPALRPMRLRDLEQIARMPRETVRRKLLQLEQLGYVSRGDDGWTYRSDAIDEQMRAFNLETARRVLALSREIERLLCNAYDTIATADKPPI